MLQARVLRNHARILAAAQDAAAEHGWSGMTLASVGKAAGLTPRPVRDRYPNKALLGAATWAEVAGPALLAALSDALSAAGLLDEPSQEGAFVDSMNALARPKTGLRAAAELLVVSAFEVDMRAAVEVSLGATLREWLDPDKAGGPARAARRGYLLALSLGLICVARRPGAAAIDFEDEWRRLLDALRSDREPVPLPDVRRAPHLAFIEFDTGDQTTDDLLRAAIDHLGMHGFEGSVLAAVAESAGVSESTIYLRYPTKEAFFMDAINRHQDIAMPGQRATITLVEQEHGLGIAEAVAIRDTMHPRERMANIIEMERVRLTWHRPNLAAQDEERLQKFLAETLVVKPGYVDFIDRARVHVGRAMGVGISFLPLVNDDAWRLPYDVISVPFNET